MNRLQFQRAMLAGLIVVLVVAALWCVSVLGDSRKQARSAVENLAVCQRLAVDIQALRQRPAIAGQPGIELTNLARRIDSAKAAAGIPDASLVRIEPQEPRRLADGPYMEQLTQVALRQVTMQQCITFLHALSDERSGLSVRELRLTAPQDTADTTAWTADVTLRYLTNAPPSADNTVRAGSL